MQKNTTTKHLEVKMNKQSSIEWLKSIVTAMIQNGGDADLLAVLEHIEQAKEMHKQEIGYTFSDGWNDCEKSFKDEQLENDEYCDKHPNEKIMTQRFCNICQAFGK